MDSFADRIKESLAAAPGQIWETLKQKWDQGRDELGKILNHQADGYMPWPEHQESNVVDLHPPKHEPQIESPRQSAQVISIDALARKAVEGVKIEPAHSVSLGSLGNLSPPETPRPYSPKPIRQEQKPLTM